VEKMTQFVNKNEQNRVWSVLIMAIARLSVCKTLLDETDNISHADFQNIGSILDETGNELVELIPIDAIDSSIK